MHRHFLIVFTCWNRSSNIPQFSVFRGSGEHYWAKAGVLTSGGSVSSHCSSDGNGCQGRSSLLLISCVGPHAALSTHLPHSCHVSRTQKSLRKWVLRGLLEWWSTQTDRQAVFLADEGQHWLWTCSILLVRWSESLCWIYIWKLERESQLHSGNNSGVTGQRRQRALDSVPPSWWHLRGKGKW